MEGITRLLSNFKRDKKAVSNVLVVVLSLTILVVIVSKVVLWSYEMNRLDWEMSRENIEITDVEFSWNQIQVSIMNTGSLSTRVVALWIINSTKHERLNINLHVNSGETITYAFNYTWSLNETYIIKAITERGNMAISTINFTISNGAMLAYGEQSGAVAKYRKWNGNLWGLEEDSNAISGTIQWVVLKSSPIRNEKVLGVLSSNGDLYVSVWNGDEQTWTPPLEVANVGTTLDYYRVFDIAYEQNSGRALIVYNPSSTGYKPFFRIWNGSAWSSPQEIQMSSTAVIYWIKLASKPRSNEIAMITLHSNQRVYGMIWDGESWSHELLLENSASTYTRECIALEYTQISKEAMFVWGAGTYMHSRVWNGSAWSGELPVVNIGATCYWFSLKADPNSDKLILVSIDSASDLNTVRWDGESWTLDAEHDNRVETNGARCADAEFEDLPGHEGHILLVWGDRNTDQITYRHFDGGSWSSKTKVSTSVIPTTDQRWHILKRCSDGKILLACIDDGQDINTAYWNGEQWFWTGEVEPEASVINRANFDLAPDAHYENTFENS